MDASPVWCGGGDDAAFEPPFVVEPPRVECVLGGAAVGGGEKR